jgi:hypothetical protein
LSSKKRRRKTGVEHLQRIIDLCKSVEERNLDPFLVDVNGVLSVIREYFSEWKSLNEFTLDAEAINRLASVIKLQGDWVKHRSTSLYTDPFLLEEKIRKMSKEELVDHFLGAWHPIVELEQISPYSLVEAIRYWESLLPLNERWLKTYGIKTEPGAASREELIRQRILLERAFVEELETLWVELKSKAGDGSKVYYWDFVGAGSYEETLRRAYLTSFLVTYGYATLEVHPLEEEVYIKPYEKPVSLAGKEQLVSVPVSLSFEEWKRWKSRRRD